MTEMQVEVDCYSGYKADERPVRFRLGGHEYQVEELLDQWYGQNDVFFKVRGGLPRLHRGLDCTRDGSQKRVTR